MASREYDRAQRLLRKELRKQATRAERKLWKSLRARRHRGWKFRRQITFGRYIADFFCPAARLIVELDGGYHNHERQVALDQERDRFLERAGLRVLRYTNVQILEQHDEVLCDLQTHLEKSS